MKALPPSAITNPFFASYITSFVRAVLGEIMNRIPPDKVVFSATTDGFITDAVHKEIEGAQGGTLATLFMQARTELAGNATILEQKHSVRQLIGWQTRGQATLKPGSPNSADPNHHMVLARGGIATPVENDNDVELDNDFIVKTFFSRNPTSFISSTVLTSVQDMVEHDADLVEKSLTRRLNMEFDWKRRPAVVGAGPRASAPLLRHHSLEEHRTVPECANAMVELSAMGKALSDHRGRLRTICSLCQCLGHKGSKWTGVPERW